MSALSTNRVTEYRYNGDGRLTQLIARNAATGDQVTEWEYGTTLAESGVASYDLVRRKVYPDGAGGSNEVNFRYDRLGELTGMTDQNGTVHEYGYDVLGRLVRDRVTEFGDGIDGEIAMILRRYNAAGLLETVAQATNADPEAPAMRDEVRLTYNGFGQLLTEEQEHNGEVESGVTPQVSYTYADGSANMVRRLTTTYPNGRVMSFAYGESDSIDDLTDRVAEIRDAGVARVGYVRRGIASTVEVGYVEPGIKLTYLRQGEAPVGDAGDNYTGLDRFNRIEDIRWLKSGEDVERFQYGFDRAGQRTWRRHVTAPDTTVTQGGWDESYRYDGLGQLVDLTRGDLNLNRTAIAAVPKWEEQFAFDATGNWLGYRTLVDGAQNLDQSREHNKANEITKIHDGVDLLDTVGYDAAGNMTTMPKVGEWTTAQTLTWDGWNRLVRVEEKGVPLGAYAYDGLVRRIWKVSQEESSADIQRQYYYSDQWQVLEERISTSEDPDRQFIWGVRYIDDLVLRDRFAGDGERLYALHDQWHVTAITDAAGELSEHYAYGAFGQSLVQAPDYTERSGSEFDWEVRFGAYRLDQETGMCQVRYRKLQPELGRWLSRDPAQEEGGFNLYRYADNASPSEADPYGLDGDALPMGTYPRDVFEMILFPNQDIPLEAKKGMNRGCVGLTSWLQHCPSDPNPPQFWPEEAPSTQCYPRESAALKRKCKPGETNFVFAIQGQWTGQKAPKIVEPDGQVSPASISHSSSYNYVSCLPGERGNVYVTMDHARNRAYGLDQNCYVLRFPPDDEKKYPHTIWCSTCKCRK